jgi:hypothetical protein
MDWELAVKRNREQLKVIVLALFAVAKMRVGGSLFTLRRDVFAAIMLVLRPAESAVRRLIVIAAFGLYPPSFTQRVAKPGGWPDLPPRGGDIAEGGRGGQEKRKAFKLFDPLKSFDPEDYWDVQPFWDSNPAASDTIFHYTSTVETPLDATNLGQRLNALIRALDNLPHQARRLARWHTKRDAALKAHRPTRISPMRPGLPPGWRQRRIHEIDHVLRECHGLAHDRLDEPDTS